MIYFDITKKFEFLDKKKALGSVKFWLVLLVGLYLGYELINNAFCSHGLLACGNGGFGVIFPFYLLIMPFVVTLNFFAYIVLFLLSSAFYVYVAYKAGGWVEDWLLRIKYRPQFIQRNLLKD